MINVDYMILFYTRATNLISPFTCLCVDLVHLVYWSIKNHFLVKGKIKKESHYLDIVGDLFAPTKFQCDVITNENERCPVIYGAEFSGFSHAIHCLVKGFASTFSFHKMLIEMFHKLKSGPVVNRPQ